MVSAFGVSLSLFLLQAQTIEAFVLPSTSSNCKSIEFCKFETRQSLPREFQTRRFAGLDDEDDFDEDDYDDDNGPLAKGLDSVSWLPTVSGAKGDNMPIDSAKEGTEILPVFPLGGIVYTPNTEHVLNIFEPRYRQMYTDILMNGSKRFVVVTSHPTEEGVFAQTGVLFELEDLKEVSEQTQDQIKYICNHKVTGRVTINKILNPEAWSTRATYLKAEGVIHDDSGKDAEPKDEADAAGVYGAVIAAAVTKDENALRIVFKKLVDLQHELEEDVRFTKAAASALAVKDGPDEDGLWQTIRLWQSFIEQRTMSRSNELQQDFQDKLKAFLKESKGLQDGEMPSAIGFEDLNEELQQELQELKNRMKIELQPLALESSLTMQKIIEAEDHAARCKLLRYFMQAEITRLSTKKSLMGLFSSEDSTVEEGIPADEMIPKVEEVEEASETKTSSIFDEPDAFQ